MTGAAQSGPTRSSVTDRSVNLAGQLIVAIADGETREAAALLRRLKRQKLNARALIVTSLISAGALRAVHGDAWKEHVTDYPDNLDKETP